jgi:hypothetical protein
VVSAWQVVRVDAAIADTDRAIQETQERINELLPPDMDAASALTLAHDVVKGGKGGRGRTEKNNKKAKGGSKAGGAGIPAVLPGQPAIPPHFVPFTFHLPGREPFSVRPVHLSLLHACMQRAAHDAQVTIATSLHHLMCVSLTSQWRVCIVTQLVVEVIVLQRRLCILQEFVDPNEPPYCYCQQPSQGEMIGCDGPNCKHEWFHYACVGMTEPAPEVWYCKDCEKDADTGG